MGIILGMSRNDRIEPARGSPTSHTPQRSGRVDLANLSRSAHRHRIAPAGFGGVPRFTVKCYTKYMTAKPNTTSEKTDKRVKSAPAPVNAAKVTPKKKSVAKNAPTKKTPAKKITTNAAAKKAEKPAKKGLKAAVSRRFQRIRSRHAAFMARRPHRSFRRTRRRDYARSLKVPGYIALTASVTKMFRAHWKTFVMLLVVYTAVIILVGGVTNQDTYTQISSLLKDSTKDIFGDGAHKVGEAGLMAISAVLTGPQNLSVDQQIYLFLALLFVWLCTVWLLREFMMGRKPRLRDGVYNSGAPIMSTLLVIAILIFQLFPVGLVALVYAGLTAVGLLDGGFGSMLFWVFAATVGCLVLYWITSTIVALVVVTLPGMYPMRAIRAAGDLVVGRRLRILLRLLWGVGCVVLAWAIVMIPIIILNTAISAAWPPMKNIPLVPFFGALMSSISVAWFASYVYLFYRKVIDDDAKPA